MSLNVTASDRKSLIRLAASLPARDEQRREILRILSGTKRTAMIAEDDRGDEYEIEELEPRVKDTIKELESLLKNSKDFLKKLQSGSLRNNDSFLDFTPAMDDGYDRTGPMEITIVD